MATRRSWGSWPLWTKSPGRSCWEHQPWHRQLQEDQGQQWCLGWRGTGEWHGECIYLGLCNQSQAIGCHLASSQRRCGSTKWLERRPWWWCFHRQASRQGHWPCLGNGEEQVWHWWCVLVWRQPGFRKISIHSVSIGFWGKTLVSTSRNTDSNLVFKEEVWVFKTSAFIVENLLGQHPIHKEFCNQGGCHVPVLPCSSLDEPVHPGPYARTWTSVSVAFDHELPSKIHPSSFFISRKKGTKLSPDSFITWRSRHSRIFCILFATPTINDSSDNHGFVHRHCCRRRQPPVRPLQGGVLQGLQCRGETPLLRCFVLHGDESLRAGFWGNTPVRTSGNSDSNLVFREEARVFKTSAFIVETGNRGKSFGTTPNSRRIL